MMLTKHEEQKLITAIVIGGLDLEPGTPSGRLAEDTIKVFRLMRLLCNIGVVEFEKLRKALYE